MIKTWKDMSCIDFVKAIGYVERCKIMKKAHKMYIIASTSSSFRLLRD